MKTHRKKTPSAFCRPSDEQRLAAYAELQRTFGANLKRLRERAGFKIYGVARVLEVSSSAWGRWECGERFPTADMLVAIALFFRVSVRYLLTPRA